MFCVVFFEFANSVEKLEEILQISLKFFWQQQGMYFEYLFYLFFVFFSCFFWSITKRAAIAIYVALALCFGNKNCYVIGLHTKTQYFFKKNYKLWDMEWQYWCFSNNGWKMFKIKLYGCCCTSHGHFKTIIGNQIIKWKYFKKFHTTEGDIIIFSWVYILYWTCPKSRHFQCLDFCQFCLL